ncbi:pol-like protein [Colletotrichum kahawae]|uniref:Pol-like protein n=1 Tax=Colletotrichum kahawae TaxID=34407 RepID=A0AAD9YAM3_COLKA|nr:pol-like protein [Colletotrichum kahawae]
MEPHESSTIDPPEGSVNDAMNDQIAQQTAQMTQLLTALNGLMSTDRATPTPLASSVTTPSTADTTVQATSDDRMMAVEGRRKPLPDPPKFTGKRKEYAGWS